MYIPFIMSHASVFDKISAGLKTLAGSSRIQIEQFYQLLQ
jgi:hypothetical protein